ncbi:MAG: hypothetical protein CMJ49_03120 [Planctomycetaceae bacterium]|nr:hypothetical protein [Planctomycetaceae bacterium]
MMRTLSITFALLLFTAPLLGAVPEHLWLEAEHFRGIEGYCWPMGPDEVRQTDGAWGLSGPGWAAEWTQGGESGFLSIAAGPNDDRAVVHRDIELPVAGRYYVWARYGDWREKTERFEIHIEQDHADPWIGKFGRRAVIEEDNVMKLYWGWAFGWDHRTAPLRKGKAHITLRTTQTEADPRQIDVIVLTTDANYHPRVKDRPPDPAWAVLESYRDGIPRALEPLARHAGPVSAPDTWRMRTFQDKSFVYLWNVGRPDPIDTWLSGDPNSITVPYNIGDDDTRAEFESKYAGRNDIPIFSDPRIVPTFHGSGPAAFRTDPDTGELTEQSRRFAQWLDEHPQRLWAGMMNYAPDTPLGDPAVEMFQQYRDRYVGSIAGESLGYFYVPTEQMQPATEHAMTRRAMAEAFEPITLETNAAKYREVFGWDLLANPFEDVISCLSVGNITFMPLLSRWGVRTIGYESAVATSSVLNMRWAFMRGAARQGDHLTATYRSCNFGDSATMFSDQSSYHRPRNILDNYYSVYSGAGMTWYKFDIWYQYMAGASMFYHEQGFDEFWKPGGTTVAGLRDVQLSPKGKLVDRFLRVTAEADFVRGDPITPIAFLVDYAHGWEPAPFWPNAFKNWHQQSDRLRPGDHEKMLESYFWTAYYPIGPNSQRPITATNEVYLPGVFGDIFDVIFADPDVDRWRTIDTYPVVVAAGEIELTAAEGQRLAAYVEQGGTLVVADAHLTGPGVAALNLPTVAQRFDEVDQYGWLRDPTMHDSPRFAYRRIETEGGRVLGWAPDGGAFCAAFDRGEGRLIYLSVPHGMTIGRQAHPVVARLLAHLSRGLMPVEVAGDVQWMVNEIEGGWMVTLLNPAGQSKPQQGMLPTDYTENRTVTIRARRPLSSARDRLAPDDVLTITGQTVTCEVPAGAVRIVELK